MWVFTIYGFFSVVNKTDQNPNNGLPDIDSTEQIIEVRSRYREHLESLKERFNEQIGGAEILGYDDPGSPYLNGDYEYRIIISAEDWVHLGAMLSADVTYYDFKDELFETIKENPSLSATPYLSQVDKVYDSVQNEDRWVYDGPLN